MLAAAAAFSLSSCSLDLRLCMTASRLCPCHASATCHNNTPENLSLMQLADRCASTWLTTLKLGSQFWAAQQWQCHLSTTHAFTIVNVQQTCGGYLCVSKASRQPVQPSSQLDICTAMCRHNTPHRAVGCEPKLYGMFCLCQCLCTKWCSQSSSLTLALLPATSVPHWHDDCCRKCVLLDLWLSSLWLKVLEVGWLHLYS